MAAPFDIPHSTYILMWNPEISSTTMDDFREWIYSGEHLTPNWSIYEWENPTWDDDFYLVKVGGEGENGVVMDGSFEGLPYLKESWRGDGSFIFYRNLYIRTGFDPVSEPILKTSELKKAIPDFNWEGGHSGRKLTTEQAKTLDALWIKHLKEHKDVVDRKKTMHDYNVDPRLKGKIKGFQKWQRLWDSYEEAISEGSFHDSLNLSFSHDYDAKEFHIKVWVMPNNIMHIVAHKVQKIEMDLDNGVSYGDYISFWKLGDFIKIECNGIKLLAREVEIKSMNEYNKESIPGTI